VNGWCRALLVVAFASTAGAAPQDAPASPVPSPPPGQSTATFPPPPPGAPEGTAAPADTTTAGRPRPWLLSLRLSEAWDSNAPFEPGVSDESSFLDDAGASLRYLRRGRRVDVSFGADASGQRYRGLRDEEQFSYGGSGGLTARLSPRATLTAAVLHGRSYARRTALLTDSGLLLPLVATRSTSGGLGASVEVTSRTRWSMDARYERADFDGEALLGGSQFGLSTQLARRLGSRQRVGVIYSFARAPNLDRSSHTLQAAWSSNLTPRWLLSLGGGASRVNGEVAGGGATVTATGSVGLTASFPRTTLDLRYARGVSQAFGFGRLRVSDDAALGLRRLLGRRLSGGLTFAYNRSREVGEGDLRFNTQRIVAEASWAISRFVSLDGSYALGRLAAPDPADPVASHSWRLGLGYQRPW
jgi:hypothetical protein